MVLTSFSTIKLDAMKAYARTSMYDIGDDMTKKEVARALTDAKHSPQDVIGTPMLFFPWPIPEFVRY